MKRLLFIAVLAVAVAGIAFAQTGTKKKRPLPHDYGRVVLNNFSERAGMAPVVFNHWIHRSRFSCRLCHVDIAFAMTAGTTHIKAADNMGGYYCGTCHNGKMVIQGKTVFEACTKKERGVDMATCDRCHSLGKHVKTEYDFPKFSEKLPKERFGNGINWEKAEADGIIKPIDFLEGVTAKRSPLKIQKDFTLEAKMGGMPEIIFSHKKHTSWNGCDLCHPEIFVGVKKGTTKYGMVEIFDGKFCGVCHGKVAFPLLDCQRCHSKPVS